MTITHHSTTQGTLSEDSPHDHPESKQITVQYSHFQKAVCKGTVTQHTCINRAHGGRRSSLFWKAYFQVLQSGPWKTGCKGEIAPVTRLFSAICRSPIILFHQISRDPSCMLFSGIPTPPKKKMPPSFRYGHPFAQHDDFPYQGSAFGLKGQKLSPKVLQGP